MPKEIWTDDQLTSLINDIKTGDRTAAKKLISNYADDIYFRVKMIYKEKEAISQAYQNTCRSLIDHIDEFNASEDDFSKWIDGCAEGVITASILPIQTESTEHEYRSSDDQVKKDIQLPEEEKALRHGVQHAMNVLTVAESVALCARHYDHLSIKEIAEKLSCTEDDIIALLANAKAALHENKISLDAVIAAMHKLNPTEEKEPVPIAPVIPAAAIAETETIKRPASMKKWLIPGVAAMALIAGLAIFISGNNSKKPNTANNEVQTTETEKQDNNAAVSEGSTANSQNSSDGTADNSAQSGSASQSTSNDNGFHGLHVEDSITDEDLENSPSVNPGSQSGTASSGSSSTPIPASGGQSGNTEGNTGSGETQQGTEPANPGEDSSDPIQYDEEVDLGGGEILGGF